MKFTIREIPVKIGENEPITIGLLDHLCDNCDTPLKREYEDMTYEVLHYDRRTIPNYIGALEIKLEGTYGGYFDQASDKNSHFLMCKKCADALLEAFPLFKKILE